MPNSVVASLMRSAFDPKNPLPEGWFEIRQLTGLQCERTDTVNFLDQTLL